MFIIYTSSDEAIVCTPETEAQTIKEYFKEGERDMDDFDREEANDYAISFTSNIRRWS
jgi:hypothetical protein